ncbi:MAG: tRNA preQ1(34) S-adenosylmethionine ribosyltransferase-isomerase QueA [Acidobacteriota bacterium]|nr:tRNA preQ1(34) S-adenosylmethionine ribosyltransferase-isomerase QueA [Acidobacteriota bacterium]
MTFDTHDYVFDLPVDRIAQHPADRRDASRLMVALGDEPPKHHHFAEIGQYLRPGDVLVLNQTRVMKARCFAVKETGTRIETFILSIQVDPGRVPVLLRPAKRVKPDMILTFPNSGVRARLIEKGDQGRGILAFDHFEALQAAVEADGELPLPPYIKREEGPGSQDSERYQTVYARDLGAVAAPTAGLHFTPELLEDLQRQGVDLCYVTHHVGIGTFKPLTASDIREHQMDAETYTIEPNAADRLNLARNENRRIIAVGTTSTRCLESNYRDGFHAGTADTDHYIYPGYRFRAIDGLITNFHLPGSSLILLVSALAGRERILALYREAIEHNYRFYSYGDAMLLLP